MSTTIPTTQYAVQLVGPGQLKLNPAKEVCRPGPHQLLARIECVGLCFSDLKLLKQFDQHPRKSGVVKGLTAEALGEMPNYVPGSQPTVPGHEVTCGEKARSPSDCRSCWATSTSRARSPPGSGVSDTRMVSPIPSFKRIDSADDVATIPFIPIPASVRPRWRA